MRINKSKKDEGETNWDKISHKYNGERTTREGGGEG